MLLEVFVPLLSNPENHKTWPPIVAQDVQKHVHSLKSTVYQVKGQVSGQTVLPMPVGVERVHEAERLLIESGGEIVDLYLKSAIEGVVIKWATQINDVLIEESSQAFANGQNPTPLAEINFWNARLKNLEYIYDQLRDERVRKMAIILERTDSAYYPCFRTQFQNVVAALAEAKDIVLYLKPLLKHFSALEETDFAEVTPCLQPLMHTVCLVWANSRYYCNSSKIIVLLRQICNLLIQQAKKFLDPASIFQSDIDEAKQRVLESVATLQRFRQIFEEYREKLGTFFHKREPVPWSFHPKIVFERYQAFLDRLDTVKRFFDTVMEFTKLEKVVIGGLRGRQLTSKVVAVYKEFSELLGAFGNKSYDALDPEDFAFVNDYMEFQGKINDLDRRLASVLCQAFDDCCNLESVFKLIEIVGSVLERPLIKEEFTGKFDSILKMLDEEITVAMELYEIQMNSLEKYGWMPVDRNMPPVAGALCWANQLRQRMAVPVKSFLALQHPIASCPEAEVVVAKYYKMVELLAEFEKKVFSEWVAVVPEQCERNLQLSLLTRKKKSKELALNFHPQLAAILREVHYLNLMEHKGIPQAALLIYERNETFRKYTANLNQTILWYNKVRQCTRAVEFALVEEQIKEIDALVEKGRTSLNWNSSELWEYIENLHNLVHSLETRVQCTQDNLMEIQTLMNIWNRVALFQRRDGKKDTLLAIEDRQERIQKRYAEISNAATEIHNLVNQNLKLFGLEEDQQSPKWRDYVNYVDSIVSESLLKTVGCSLGYLADNMDPNNNSPPLFEIQLELRDPDLVFLPSLDPSQPDNFISLVEGLIKDIIKMASLVPRVTNDTSAPDYETEMETNEDIVEMKKEILDGVKTTIEEATEFSGSFESYSYLWLDDRETYMQQFLTYGHQLTNEELEALALEDDLAPKPCAPSMEQFREQIDNFENLYVEIEEMKPIQVFNSWFQVDLRPFRQALLNTVRKWGNMFKQHLVDHVTNSLSDLAKFIHEADEGLQQTVEEGDYDSLVNVMGYLMNVKDRQLSTDDMFEPLRQTIELLKFYDQELPEEVNVLLQVKQGSDGALALLYLLCFLLFHLPEPACS